MEFAVGKCAWPIWVKLGLAGLVVGMIALIFPGVWGNGYEITNQILHADSSKAGLSGLVNGSVAFGLEAWQIPIFVLTGLLIAKLAATVVTVGTGTIGGVFTPTLFLGAGIGAAFGEALDQLGFANETPTIAFALVGMGSILAATTRSPLLAMILIFEISLKYELIDRKSVV